VKAHGSNNPRAAIAVPSYINSFTKYKQSNRDTIVIKIEQTQNNKALCLVSAYFDILFNEPVIGPQIQEIVSLARTSNWGLLISADSNAHSALWGSTDQNPRGDCFEEFIAENSLIVKNIGSVPAFVTANGKTRTIIDITITNLKLDINVTNWKVSNYATKSDHKLITFSIDFVSTQTYEARNYRKANWPLIKEVLTRSTKIIDPKTTWSRYKLDSYALELENSINKALDQGCPLKTTTISMKKSKTPEWFKPETAKLSKDVDKKSKRYRRNPTTGNKIIYKAAVKCLKYHIRANKTKCWQCFSETLTDMKSFSKVTRSLTGAKTPEIGMLKDPSTGLETNTVDDVARVLLDPTYQIRLNLFNRIRNKDAPNQFALIWNTKPLNL
jgi:hypothetical protein